MKIKNLRPRNIFEELLLYSGQFGLFYIIMQLIIEKSAFFTNFGHMGLLFILLAQAFLLALRGEKWQHRILLSFIVPVFYSLFELEEGTAHIMNAAHMGFWIYALITSLLMVLRSSKKDVTKRTAEIILVSVNVLIFLFLYFYFDTWKEIQNTKELTVTVIFRYLPDFFSDPTHWYIIIGGTFLAVTIAIGRNDIARLKDRIASLFGKYVDTNISGTIINQGEFSARNENLCVLFSDIFNFTRLCNRTDAATIGRMLNVYFEYWTSIVKKHNGTVDKYIGDAIMVIFGLQNNSNACSNAVACAMEAVAGQQQLIANLSAEGLPAPDGFGIGCHFGELIVGDIGSSERKNFTVIGDTVNIASRLESLTRKTESRIIISDTTWQKLGMELRNSFKKLGKATLKGIDSGVRVWGKV